MADLEDGPAEAEALRSGLRIALLGRGVRGEMSATGLRGLEAAAREGRGVPAGEDVVMVKRCRDWARSLSPSRPSLLCCRTGCAIDPDAPLDREGDVNDGDAISGSCRSQNRR